jgi:PmbA protein
MSDLTNAAERVIQRAIKKGATAADVLIREEDTFAVTVRMGEVETLKQAISRGMLLRVFVGKRTAASNSSDLSEAVIERLVDETVSMAALTSEDESGDYPTHPCLRPHFEPGFTRLSMGDAVARATHRSRGASGISVS